MSNKRNLKKSINKNCTVLFADCVAESLYGEQKRTDKEIDTILSSILLFHADYISRISHPEPGMKQKDYFKQLIEDFNKQVGELIDQFTSVG